MRTARVSGVLTSLALLAACGGGGGGGGGGRDTSLPQLFPSRLTRPFLQHEPSGILV